MNSILRLSGIALLLTFHISVHAQEAVGSVGGDASGTDGSASFTIGEAVYTDISESNQGSVSQGVQQAYDVMTGLDDMEGLDLLLHVFPNPAEDYIQLQIALSSIEDLSYLLYDVHGRLLDQNRVTEYLMLIPLNEYPPGNYFLEVRDKASRLQSFPIIKHL